MSDGNTIKNIVITQDDIKVEGQTRGEWVFLGKYQLAVGNKAYVEITNNDADNVVTADAVLFIPIKN